MRLFYALIKIGFAFILLSINQAKQYLFDKYCIWLLLVGILSLFELIYYGILLKMMKNFVICLSFIT